MAEIKYSVKDKIKTKIHYENDERTEVEAVIYGIEWLEYEDGTDIVRYKIGFNPEERDRKMGCKKCFGYVMQDDILGYAN